MGSDLCIRDRASGDVEITSLFDGKIISKKVSVKNNPVTKVELTTDLSGYARTGDVINLSAKLRDKKGKLISGIQPEFSFSGIAKNNRIVISPRGAKKTSGKTSKPVNKTRKNHLQLKYGNPPCLSVRYGSCILGTRWHHL